MSDTSTPAFEAAKVVSRKEFSKRSRVLHRAELTLKEKALLGVVEYPLHAVIAGVSMVHTFREAFNDAAFLKEMGIQAEVLNTTEGLFRDNENKPYLSGAFLEHAVKEVDASPLNKVAPKKLREKSRALDVRAFADCKDHQHNLLVKPSTF